MTDLIVVPQAELWQRLKGLVLDSVSSPITRRVYNLGLDEFFEWYGREPRPGFTKAIVTAWRVALEARGLGAVSIIVRITPVRKLAVEAADSGLLAPELANGITRVKGVASKGIRLGNWLTVKQAQTLLNTPDITTIKGLRDRAILAVLLGCGLRRSEVAALTVGHVQQRDGRWCIVDLVGKQWPRPDDPDADVGEGGARCVDSRRRSRPRLRIPAREPDGLPAGHRHE
jgi:site-specific recombinase XerD